MGYGGVQLHTLREGATMYYEVRQTKRRFKAAHEKQSLLGHAVDVCCETTFPCFVLDLDLNLEQRKTAKQFTSLNMVCTAGRGRSGLFLYL